jgi:hypothetical protein
MVDSIPSHASQAILDAEAKAKTGDFSGLPAVIAGLAHENPDVRLRAAYVAGRIGWPQTIDQLSEMALQDNVSDNRSQAILSFAGIGRPTVVPALIEALNNDEVERRMDARITLYRVLGADVFDPLADEDESEGPDEKEVISITTWWQERMSRFDTNRVYAFGMLASPGVFVQQLETAESLLPDAYLHALTDWTGQEFGQSPLPKLIAQWKQWWSAHQHEYETGRRYYYGYPVP